MPDAAPQRLLARLSRCISVDLEVSKKTEQIHAFPRNPYHHLVKHYQDGQLNLKNVFLSFAGRKPSQHRMHRAIAALSPGDPLHVRERSGRWELLDDGGIVVGVLAQSFVPPKGMVCTGATVLAIVCWSRQHSEPQYQEQILCDTWEVVVPELIFEPS